MSKPVTLWDSDHLHIGAEITNDGRLQIAGQDLRAMGGEYEYILTIEQADIPRVVAALGAHKETTFCHCSKPTAR